MRGISAVAVVIGLFASLAGAGPAWAGTLNFTNGEYVFTGTSGNDNLSIGLSASCEEGNSGDTCTPSSITRFFESLETIVVTGDAASRCGPSNTVVICGAGEEPVRAEMGAGNDTVDATFLTDNGAPVPDYAPRTLIGGDGEDMLWGAAGDDLFVPGTGPDIANGGGGRDRISYNDGRSSGVTVALVAPRVFSQGGTADGAFGDSLSDITDITGSAAADTLTGSAGANSILGLDGSDVINGGAGADQINGGTGNDTITPGAGDDGVVDGGPGTDVISYAGSSSPVTVTLASDTAQDDGGADDGAAGEREEARNFEAVRGSAFADVLVGSDGVNSIFGEGGDDRIDGGIGQDNLDGGDGYDVVDYSDRSEDLTVALFEGASGFGGGPTDKAEESGPGLPDFFFYDSLDGFEEVLGGSGADQMFTDTAPMTFRGNGGADDLQGSSAADVLDGGEGADLLDGKGGLDTATYAGRSEPVAVTLADGTGDDGGAADGEAGARDTLANIENVTGGDGADALTGDAGPNVLDGGPGNDVLTGLAGADSLFGRTGVDELRAQDGEADQVDCGEGVDLSWLVDPVDTVVGCDTATPAPPNGGQPGGGPAPTPVVPSVLTFSAKHDGRWTRVTRVRVTDVPAGATVRLSCKAKRKRVCPIRVVKKSFAQAVSKADLTPKKLRRNWLPSGVTITLEISVPGSIGKVLTLKTRGKKKPQRTTGCLAADTGGPIACP